MYSLIVRDYSIADIEAFSALSIRRGSTIASLAKASSDNLRIVTGAWLLFLPKAADEAAVRASAERFLAGPGAWMNETPEGLVAAALESGLLEKTFEGFANGLAPRPNVTAARLTDELETAAAILAARRARTREALQAKNRAVNSGEPPVDDEADRRFMTEALAEARAAAQAGEVPVGAVLVADGRIIACAGNRTLRNGDPTAHAEMLVLREGARVMKNHRLAETTLYVTLEPCPMCAGAIVQARPGRIVFGATDERMGAYLASAARSALGAVGGALSLFELPGVNHRPWVRRGVMAQEAKTLLADFFAARRGAKENEREGEGEAR